MWDPDQYLRFADQRLRPALDLLSRIPVASPGTVVDLGCGAGNVTAHLRARWPDARIVGVDRSPDMLDAARRDHAGLDVEWVRADVSTWRPDERVEVVFSNATLHWLDDHLSLFPSLFATVAAGGAFAVQVPANFDRPVHTAARATVEEGPWADRLRPVLLDDPVVPLEEYRAWLASEAEYVDAWETDYLQVFDDSDAVTEWAKGSLLRPLLATLDEPDRAAFERDYRRRLRAAYPPGADGTTTYRMRRSFVIALRRS